MLFVFGYRLRSSRDSRDGKITELGTSMIHFPLSPFLSRAVIASIQYNCVDELLIIASMLSVENIFVRPGHRDKLTEASQLWSELASLAGGNNDFLTLLYIFQQCSKRLVYIWDTTKVLLK